MTPPAGRLNPVTIPSNPVRSQALPQPQCINGRSERFLLGFLCGIGFCVALGGIGAYVLMRQPTTSVTQSSDLPHEHHAYAANLRSNPQSFIVGADQIAGPAPAKISPPTMIRRATPAPQPPPTVAAEKDEEEDAKAPVQTTTMDPEMQKRLMEAAAMMGKSFPGGFETASNGDESTMKLIMAQLGQLKALSQGTVDLDSDDEMPPGLPPALLEKLDPNTKKRIQEATAQAHAQIDWMLAQARGEEVPDVPPQVSAENNK